MNYLYIISKQEFTSLYRFGQIPFRLDLIIDCNNLSKSEIEDKLMNNFNSLAYFVGDEEYLMISLNEDNNSKTKIFIENVTEIIPMTKAAKSSLEMKFDNRLIFSEPRFEEVVHKFEENIDIEERFNGAKAFCKLSKINEPFEKLINDEVIINSYLLRLNNVNPSTNPSYYTQLLAYERYEFFPNNDLGFFYDAGEAFAHFKGLPTFVGSDLYNFLQNNKSEYSNKTFIEIADSISNVEEIKKFRESLTINEVKEFVVAALFQKFKTDLRERDTIIGSETGRTIGYIKKDKKYFRELNFAIYLTGAFFGYKKFYDDLYNKLEINIFRTENITTAKSLNKNKPTISEIELTVDKINSSELDKVLADLIVIINNTSNGLLKVEKETLKELQLLFKPKFKGKKITKPEIINFIKSEYINEIDIIKKDTISIIKQPKFQ
jgi:hypothetical protein